VLEAFGLEADDDSTVNMVCWRDRLSYWISNQRFHGHINALTQTNDFLMGRGSVLCLNKVSLRLLCYRSARKPMVLAPRARRCRRDRLYLQEISRWQLGASMLIQSGLEPSRTFVAGERQDVSRSRSVQQLHSLLENVSRRFSS
jgi:hypothetical protein